MAARDTTNVEGGEAQTLTAHLTAEAERLLNFAAWIGANQSAASGQLSFLSPFIALLASTDRVSRALQRVAAQGGLSAERISGVSADGLAEWRNQSTVALPRTEKPLFTESGEEVLTAAQRLADELSGASRAIEIRHILAAYIYTHQIANRQSRQRPHGDELHRLGLDLEKTSRALVAIVEEQHPEESPAWRQRHYSDFRTQLPATPSARIVRDYWTVEDTLGYSAYARAIALFLTHRQTLEPLCVSIQAPWGAGKTSLMRMIQKRLDPLATQAAEARSGLPITPVEAGARTREALAVLDDKGGPLPCPKTSPDQKRFTVWFNAWKYQSSEQLWAGLIDAIITQVTARMSAAERELFLFRLNVARIDREAVRRRVYERIVAATWNTVWGWGRRLAGAVVASSAVAAGGAVTGDVLGGAVATAGLGGAVAIVTLTVVQASNKAKKEVADEPANVNFADFIRVPNYSARTGFIHDAAADLEQVLATIPPKYLPLVIFIDDLDRCTPDKVASAVEGVNLFLAGEFPNCLFVIGMDPQLVAAALDEAQAKLVQRLPGYDQATALGWRFMDKFVQLPFTMPPPDDHDLEHFSEAMLAGADAREAAVGLAQQAEEASNPDVINRGAATEAVHKFATFLYRARELEARQERYAETYSDESPEARRTLNHIAMQFSRNPREIKRLTNVVRLLSMMRFAREDRGLPVPSEQQYEDWVVLSLKWPDFVRWLSWAGGEGDSATPNSREQVHMQLARLEQAARDIPDFAAWRGAVAAYLRQPPESVPWLASLELHQFLAQQAARAEAERLSMAAKIGFY
jgi:KAP family P-loop domain